MSGFVSISTNYVNFLIIIQTLFAIRKNLRSLYAKQILFKIQLILFWTLQCILVWSCLHISLSSIKVKHSCTIKRLSFQNSWLIQSGFFRTAHFCVLLPCEATCRMGLLAGLHLPFMGALTALAWPVLCCLWAGGLLGYGSCKQVQDLDLQKGIQESDSSTFEEASYHRNVVQLWTVPEGNLKS